jgi:predicted nucleotidyltransferase/uncharacterized protein (UPF0332 family)
MERQQVNEIRELFQPMIEEVGDYLKSVIICGSAVRKERVEGSDIDIIVILDDHEEDFSSRELQKAKLISRKVKDKGEDKDLDLHIQPPKPISHWYNLLLRGRPWAVTSIRHSQPLYDPDDFQKTMKSLIESTPTHSEKSRSLKLYREADQKIKSADCELEEEALNQIINAVDDAGRIYLEFKGKSAVQSEELTSELDKRFDSDFEGDLSLFDELREQRKSIRDGEAFDIRKLDRYKGKAQRLAQEIEKQFERDLKVQRRDILEQVYREIKQTCREALDDLDVDYDEEAELEEFKENIIDEDLLGDEYWMLIREIQDMINQEEEPEKKEQGEILYRPLVSLRDFESAVEALMEHEFYRSFELKEKGKKAQITPVNEFEESLLEGFGENIKALWVTTVEDFLETSNANLVVLHDVDDTEGFENKIEELEKEISEEHGFNIHTRTLNIQDYWQRAQESDKEIFYETQNAIISYDPQGLIRSFKKLARTGTGLKTPESVSEKIQETTEIISEPGEEAKSEALDKYYRASIKLGQAVLLTENIRPPVQKKVPKTLRENLPENSKLGEEHVEVIRRTIRTYKQVEYGEITEIEFEELKEMGDKLEETKEKVRKIVENTE